MEGSAASLASGEIFVVLPAWSLLQKRGLALHQSPRPTNEGFQWHSALIALTADSQTNRACFRLFVPTTSRWGSFCSVKSRILAPIFSLRWSTSTRRPVFCNVACTFFA